MTAWNFDPGLMHSTSTSMLSTATVCIDFPAARFPMKSSYFQATREKFTTGDFSREHYIF